MNLEEFRDSLLEEIRGVGGPLFEHVITKTNLVPSIDDQNITYPNLIEKMQKSKLLESAVLFVDLRNSTAISLNHNQQTLAALYSTYVRSMTRAAHYFNGHVRNIIGDRVMVVFDRENCYRKAVNTAMLMNSVANYMLNKETSAVQVKVGIGIDFGEMLITKTGIIKRGSENTSNKSLVWLGKPANVASKLTDMANKQRNAPERMVEEGDYYPALEEWGWYRYSVDEFLSRIEAIGGKIRHREQYFETFIKVMSNPPVNPPILMTKYFHDGLTKEHSELKCVKDEFWKAQDLSLPRVTGKIYGGSGYFESVAKY
jgi:adenylate cyclase